MRRRRCYSGCMANACQSRLVVAGPTTRGSAITRYWLCTCPRPHFRLAMDETLDWTQLAKEDLAVPAAEVVGWTPEPTWKRRAASITTRGDLPVAVHPLSFLVWRG